MYLTEFRVKNIKCFEDVTLTFPHRDGDYSGWIVLLGGNGTGKSTLLQAMAIALAGEKAGHWLVSNSGRWVRGMQRSIDGRFQGMIQRGNHDEQNEPLSETSSWARYVVARPDYEEITSPFLYPEHKKERTWLESGPFNPRHKGWLCCGYGPFRRITAQDDRDFGLVPLEHIRGVKQRRLGSLFFPEGTTLRGMQWLISLYNISTDPQQPNTDRERHKNDGKHIQEVINSLLPGGVQLTRVDSQGVYFRSGGLEEGTALDLSDGYRSFLALAIDLMQHIYEAVDDFSGMIERHGDDIQIMMDGVVLIDEVDAHLHPRWQREIGFRLCRAFPKVQFIVTSHSPFVAQAASDHGLFVLRQPEGSSAVEVIQPVESVRGWRADQILTDPELFGLEGTRDPETEALMRQHADLVAKREWHRLTSQENKKLAALEKKLAQRLTAPGETVAEREQQAAMQEFVAQTMARLENGK